MIMVKNFFFATAFICAMTLNAQSCMPDSSLKKPGFSPAALTKAVVNTYYNEGISVLTVRDTFTTALGPKWPVKIDSIKVLNVGGLPPGMSYKCQHPRCVFLWDTVRCISFYGTPAVSGSYPLKIYVRAFVKIGGFTPQTKDDSISSYTLEIAGNPASVWQSASASFQVYPNPGNDFVEIKDSHADATWCITDLSGRSVVSNVINKTPYSVRFSVTSLKSGIYILTDGQRKTKLLVL